MTIRLVSSSLLLGSLLLGSSASLAAPPPTGDTGTEDTGTPATTGDTGTDPGLDLDEDRDGYTPRQGDCDDANRELNPGEVEVCADRLDNDCDGLYDNACDDSAKLASLRGGGGCTGGDSVLGTQALVLSPLLLLGLAVLRLPTRGRR